jgi:3-hydroxyisobutyrate dehydrogenase
MRVGFVGTGRIGAPMVEMLFAAGCSVTFFARRQSVVDRLVARGAHAVDRVEAIADADVVISCLYDDEQLLKLAPAIVSRMPRRSVFVSHTTGTPATLLRIADIASGRGVVVVDAGFSGTAEMVRERALTVMLGASGPGAEPAIEAVGSYASKIIRTGGLGSGLRAKVLNNLLFAGICQLTLSAVVTAGTFGIDEDVFIEILASSSGGSTAVEHIRTRGGAAEFAERVRPFLRKDVEHARTVAAEANADVATLSAAASAGPLDLDASR